MKSMKMDKLTLFLIPIGVAVNFIGGQIAILLHLPLYLDAIGTIVVGALCGAVPGILVGIISNVLNSISSPTTLFYALCSILFAISAAACSKKGIFKNLIKTVVISLCFAVLGGILGACITWAINGGDFGPITASAYASAIYELLHWPAFLCQLISEFIMDLFDKVVTLILVFFILKSMPNRFLAKLPLGNIYAKEED